MAGNTIDTVAKWLVIIGGLNWGLEGVGKFMSNNLNVVDLLLGKIANGAVAHGVYVLIGLSALYMLYSMFGKK